MQDVKEKKTKVIKLNKDFFSILLISTKSCIASYYVFLSNQSFKELNKLFNTNFTEQKKREKRLLTHKKVL